MLNVRLKKENFEVNYIVVDKFKTVIGLTTE